LSASCRSNPALGAFADIIKSDVAVWAKVFEAGITAD